MVCTPSDSKRSYVNGRVKPATSRPFNDFYRRSGQTMNLVSHAELCPENYGNSPYSIKRDTPELEVKAGGPPRKRVPVAVSLKSAFTVYNGGLPTT